MINFVNDMGKIFKENLIFYWGIDDKVSNFMLTHFDHFEHLDHFENFEHHKIPYVVRIFVKFKNAIYIFFHNQRFLQKFFTSKFY